MIKIEKTKVVGFEEAIRGMRNPMNSWERSDSSFYVSNKEFFVTGPNDYDLMMKLAEGGAVHARWQTPVQPCTKFMLKNLKLRIFQQSI